MSSPPGKGLLAGKVAVVPLAEPGGERGEGIARRLAAEGAAVVLVGGAAAGRVASAITAGGQGRAAVFHLADPTDPADPAEADLDALVDFVAEILR